MRVSGAGLSRLNVLDLDLGFLLGVVGGAAVGPPGRRSNAGHRRCVTGGSSVVRLVTPPALLVLTAHVLEHGQHLIRKKEQRSFVKVL